MTKEERIAKLQQNFEIMKKIKSKSKYWSKFQAKKIVLEAKNNIEKGKALAPELLNQKEIKFCENIQKEMKKNERMFVFSTGNKIIELEHKQLYDELKKGFPTFEAENQNYLDEITGQNGAIKFVSFYKDTDLTKLTPYSLNKSTLRNLLMSNLTPKEAAILITGHSDFVNKPKPFSVETDPQKQKDANWTYYPPYGLDDDFYCDDLSVFQKPLLEKKFEGFVFELYVWDPYLSKEKQNDVNVENQRVCLHCSNSRDLNPTGNILNAPYIDYEQYKLEYFTNLEHQKNQNIQQEPIQQNKNKGRNR